MSIFIGLIITLFIAMSTPTTGHGGWLGFVLSWAVCTVFVELFTGGRA